MSAREPSRTAEPAAAVVRVGAIQHDIVWEDPPANFLRLGPMVAAAVGQGAHLVVLAEMYSTGFSMKPEMIAERAGGLSEQFLVNQARRHGVWVMGSLPEQGDDGRAANVLVAAAPHGSVTRYVKRHPFSYGGEDRHYRSGSDTVVVDVGGLRLAVFICYDLRFADDFWALAPDVHGYVVVANWPAERAAHWSTLLRARAIENQAYVVGVNRVGEGGGVEHTGASAVIGPFGEVIAEAGAEEAIVLADLDAAAVAETRARYPFLADRVR